MARLPDKCTIRRACSADQTAIKAFIYPILRDYGLSPDPAHTDRGLDDIDGFFEVFDIIVHETRGIVGTVGLVEKQASTCELVKMFVHPDCCGQGLGVFLLERALQAAATRGYTRIHLETASVLKEAIGLYRKYGFQTVDQRPEAARCDQMMERAVILPA